jgi:hypothetical protein
VEPDKDVLFMLWQRCSGKHLSLLGASCLFHVCTENILKFPTSKICEVSSYAGYGGGGYGGYQSYGGGGYQQGGRGGFNGGYAGYQQQSGYGGTSWDS